MKIVWTRYAVEDREEILEYTAARNPTAALEQDLRIEEAVGLLGDHPRAGRAGRWTEVWRRRAEWVRGWQRGMALPGERVAA